jgi:hypothetical protein
LYSLKIVFFSVVAYSSKDFLALPATALKIFSVVAYSVKKSLALLPTALKGQNGDFQV